MTNVPDDIREAWKEIYILFDTHYGMNCLDTAAVTEFWQKAGDIYYKFQERINLLPILDAVGDLLLSLYRGENGKSNDAMEWKAGEDYPHPEKASERAGRGVQKDG